MKKILAVLTFLLLFSSKSEAFTLSGFESPESFIVDPETGYYYVSNTNGGPMDKDGNGYISKINSKGNVVIQKFIGGNPAAPQMDAPKGLGIYKDMLCVTDIDNVKIFNKKTKKLIAVVDLSAYGTQFANDIAVDQAGIIYVSDMMTDQIFKIDLNAKQLKASLFVKGRFLGNPNGLLVNPKTKNLMVVTWKTGSLLEVDRNRKIHVLKRGLINLDGIDYDENGNLYVSSFEKGEIYKIPFYGRGAMSLFLNGLISPADISYDRKNHDLLIPSFRGNKITTYFIYKN